jgi:beta-mannosidase
VEICIKDRTVIADAWVRTKRITGSTAEVDLEFTIENKADQPRQIQLELSVGDEKRSMSLWLTSEAAYRIETFTLHNAPLWWPFNHGSPALLKYSIALSNNSGILDRWEGEFGVRTIELIEPPRGVQRTGFHVKVNNKPIFLKGMNWTPCDAIYARITDARYEALLAKAVEANVNTLRVWGGGIYEADPFYTLCDRRGILVWQDFMFSCGVYPQEEGFLNEVRMEAEYIVKSLRNHPSIIMWCGDNEVDWVYLQENVPNFWDNKINRQVLAETCRTLDPSRPYVPSTPFSHGWQYPNDAGTGDVHLWKHGSSYRDPYYAESQPNMVTEIGHISLPDLEVMKSFMPEEKLWPPFNECWYLHCADPNRSGDFYRVQSYFDSIAANGRPKPQSLEALIRTMQELQTEATEYWISHFSSQPECWGIFLWNLCDCWPQISDAYIAYPFHEKPALAAVREGFGRISR